MQVGRFATLEDAIEHYNKGVQSHLFLDHRLTGELMVGGTPSYHLDFSVEENAALIAFLNTPDRLFIDFGYKIQ